MKPHSHYQPVQYGENKKTEWHKTKENAKAPHVPPAKQLNVQNTLSNKKTLCNKINV